MIIGRHQRKIFIVLFIVMTAVSFSAAALMCVNMRGLLESQNLSELMSVRNKPPAWDSGSSSLYDPVSTPYFTCRFAADGGVSFFSGVFFLNEPATIQRLVAAAVSQGKEIGTLDEYNLRYCISSFSIDSKLVSFIDTSAMHAALGRYTRSVFLVLLPVLALLGVLCFQLSRWLVKPIRRMVDGQHQFIAGASHELKTPLAIISSNAELLESGPDDEKAPLWCRNIKSECRRMDDLIQGLIFVTFSSAAHRGAGERVDFSDLLEGELTRFEVVAFEKELGFSAQTEPGIAVRGDRGQLERLADILMDNAIKYCRPGGAVRVRLVRDGGTLLFSVSSDGQPLSREQCENVFIPFYRVGEGKGFGLGLSIAWETVNAMGGHIRAQGEKGRNTFTVELPCEADK